MKKVILVGLAVLFAVLLSVTVLDVIDYKKGNTEGPNIASFFSSLVTGQTTKEVVDGEETVEEKVVEEETTEEEVAVEETEEEVAEEETVVEEDAAAEEETEEEVAEESISVLITNAGFEPRDLKIKVGQEVVWVNERDDFKALLIGMRELYEMKSSIMEKGDVFSWTFDEPGFFTYVYGIVTTLVGNVQVEE
jgi:plastocyanin